MVEAPMTPIDGSNDSRPSRWRCSVRRLAALHSRRRYAAARRKGLTYVRDELVRRLLPGELLAADDHSLRLVDGTVFLAPFGMVLPAFAPGTALRVEYTIIDGQAVLRTIPERLRGG